MLRQSKANKVQRRRIGGSRAIPWMEILETRTVPSLFGPAQFFPSGGGFPSALAVGDFNHDGLLDLAVANSLGGPLSVLLGNGQGGFVPVGTISGFDLPDSVATGDFNHDGNLDLAVTDKDLSQVVVLPGNGQGGFAAPILVPVGSAPVSIAVGDFNHDGNLDLAVANSGDNSVSILLGNGIGGFGRDNISLGASPSFVAVGDFNHDGNLDLAVANSDTVSVLFGNGFGGFGVDNISVGPNPTSVAVGDFNNDGNLDFAVADSGIHSVSVLLGDGHGGFAPAGSFSVGNGPGSVAVGDFNHDGDLDLAVANSGDNTVSVLLGNGSGGFAPAGTFTVGVQPEFLAVGDFNQDGAPDLVVANSLDDSVGVLLNQTPVTTTTLSSFNPALPGERVTLQATVTEAVPQTAQPTGLVTFLDGGTVLGTGTLSSSGIAQLNTTFLTTGYQALSAVYEGDPNFIGSTSPTFEQLVNQASTAATLSSSASPGIVGQPITFTVAVRALVNNLGFGQPTGTVQFQEDEATELGAATLSNGIATLTAALMPGNHSIIAFYDGDSQFMSCLSSGLTEVVNNPAPIINNVSPGSIDEGSPTFTLTINGSNFLSNSTVQWNGTPLTITQLSGTQIQATVPGSLVADEGTAQVSVVNPGPGGGASLATTFTIADAPLTATNMNISVEGNKDFTGAVATFTDANPNATAGDFSAVITWDLAGTASLGTISGTGPFTVTGSHKFGTFTNAHIVTVAIFDRGGSTATATDTVIDPVALSPNQSFVVQLYEDLLQRPADDAGLATWTSLLDQGASRTQVARDIEASGEYLGNEVQALYQHYLHRAADSGGLASLTQFLATGGTLEQAAAVIAGSAEYMKTRGGGTAAGFLSALYQDALDRQVDAIGQAIFAKAIASGATAGQVAEAIFASTEYRQDLVTGFYEAYLDRSPDQTGLNAFVASLGQVSRDEDVVAAMLGSDEYFARSQS